MKKLQHLFGHPVFHLLCIQLVFAFVFWRTPVRPQDDDPFYQLFIETLAKGSVDLTIPGFQGSSFLAVLLHLIHPSSLTNAYFQVACAFVLPLAAYFAASGLFQKRTESLFFTYIISLMPFFSFVAFQGFTFPSSTLLMLLTLGLRARGSAFAFLPWSFAILTKPFAIALLPFFLLWQPDAKPTTWNRGWVQVLLMLPIPILYVLTQYVQVGHLIVGAHPEITQDNVFVWWRFPLNAAHGVQMLFSVHNYYFPDPAKTGPGNLVHSSPLLMIAGILALLYPKGLWKNISLARTVGISFLLAYILAAMLDHMDHFYMQTAVLMLAIAGVPFLLRYRLFIPFVLATFHFQFLYLYLAWRNMYFFDYSFFLIPAFVDAMAVLVWVILIVPGLKGGVWGYMKQQWGGKS